MHAKGRLCWAPLAIFGYICARKMITLRPYIRQLAFEHGVPPNIGEYPFNIPAVQQCQEIEFHPDVTFFVGENGAGKSTLIEAIAVAYGYNAEGGTRWSRFDTQSTHSSLHRHLRLVKSPKTPGDGFFLRAESFYNLATNVDSIGSLKSYGGKSLHAQSHGESLLATLLHKLSGNGLYIMDEPEAALSPTRQMTAITAIHQLVQQDSQFIIATHSPILLAYPRCSIYEFSEDGIARVPYEETEHYRVTRGFLMDHERMLRILMEDQTSMKNEPDST